MLISSNTDDTLSEDFIFDEFKPISTWSTNDFLSFIRYLERNLNYKFSPSTFTILRQESFDGKVLVDFQVSDLENLISKDEAELIFSSLQKHEKNLKNGGNSALLTTNLVSNNVSNVKSTITKPERKDSIVTKKSTSLENLEKTSRFGNRTGIVITRRDSSTIRQHSNNNEQPVSEGHSPNSSGNQSPFSTPTTPNDISTTVNNNNRPPPKPLGYTTRKSIALNGSIIPNINNAVINHNSSEQNDVDTSSSSSSPSSDSNSSSMIRPSLDSTGSNISMVDSVMMKKVRLVSCLINSDLDNCVKPIDEKLLRQTIFPQILNNDLTLIEQLGKYKSRYKNIYLLLTDPSSFDTIIQRKVKNSKKKKLFDVKFADTNSSSFENSAFQQTNHIEKMFPDSEQTHATTSNITIDFVSVQLSERLPLLIDFKQLNDLERILVSNVFKKLAPIDKRIFSHREKIFMAENLALPDCYNYLFFDNPTGEKSGTIFLNDSEEGNEPEKKSNFSKLFSRSSKKEEAYLQCQLVVFEFSESFMIEMKDTNRYKLFRTGIMIGNWFLEWRENSLVIPSRKPPQGLLRFNPHFHYIPLKKIEGEKNISALLSKLSEVCSLWNGTNVYNLKSCNHQHFVQDVVKALELVPLTKVEDKKRGIQAHYVLQYPFGNGVLRLLDRIERYGFSDMAFYLNQPVKEALFGKKMAMELQQQGVERIASGEAYSRLGEDEKTLVGNIEYAPESIRNKYTYKNLQQKTSNSDEVPEDKNFITFSSHAELDKVYFDLDSKIGSGSEGKDYFKTTNDGKWDLWLLKLYDRCFWIRLGTLKDGKKILNSKDAPLSNLPESSMNVSSTGSFGPCLCPFNMSGVGINEFDMQLMMLNPTSSTAFLANHEPPIPDRIWLPYQL